GDFFHASSVFFFFQAEDGIRDRNVTGVQTCALPIFSIFSYISNEISWMQQMSVTSFEMYEKMERVGRKSTRIDRSKRKYFYEVYEQYIKIREEDDRYYDFEDVGTFIRNLLKKIKNQDKKKKLLSYKYILIDEFQDFTSDMLMTVNELNNTNGAMVLLGDINQGVFGKRISFKSLGIKMNSYKKHRLVYNYRNSRPISEFA